jgi:hypothetical protein
VPKSGPRTYLFGQFNQGEQQAAGSQQFFDLYLQTTTTATTAT